MVESLLLQACHDLPNGLVQGGDGGGPVPLLGGDGGVGVLRGELAGRSLEGIVRSLEGDHHEQRSAFIVLFDDRLGAFRVHLCREHSCNNRIRGDLRSFRTFVVGRDVVVVVKIVSDLWIESRKLPSPFLPFLQFVYRRHSRVVIKDVTPLR